MLVLSPVHVVAFSLGKWSIVGKQSVEVLFNLLSGQELVVDGKHVNGSVDWLFVDGWNSSDHQLSSIQISFKVKSSEIQIVVFEANVFITIHHTTGVQTSGHRLGGHLPEAVVNAILRVGSLGKHNMSQCTVAISLGINSTLALGYGYQCRNSINVC